LLDVSERKGSYCVVFSINSLSFETKGGRPFFLEKGVYVYVGSAFGTGGLKRRVLRHLKREKRKHWHFDFITTHPSFKPFEVWLFEGKKVECELASFIGKVTEPVEGFGSTDCGCPSHLFRVEDLTLLKRVVENSFSVKIVRVSQRG